MFFLGNRWCGELVVCVMVRLRLVVCVGGRVIMRLLFMLNVVVMVGVFGVV